MLLSAALIVRDEAQVLDDCLNSLRGLVDEIVVVDTGSQDESVAIAESHRAVVLHEAWRDDFSHARNTALDRVTGEWVLYIDADERVREGDHAAARDALASDHDRVAGLVPFVPRVGWTPYREYRLWRNRNDIRFRGAMHETIVPTITDVSDREGLRVDAFDLLTIDHFGYEGDQRHKYDRDEPLLLAELEAQPERSYLFDHLARIREGRGDDAGAVDMWRRGIAMTDARSEANPDDHLLHVNLISHLLARGAVDEAGVALEEALTRLDRRPGLELAAARHDFATGRPESAIARIEWILALTPEQIIDTGSSYDGRVFGEWAHDLLGLCRFALNDFVGAAAAFAEAQAAAPDVPVYRTRRELALSRIARSDP